MSGGSALRPVETYLERFEQSMSSIFINYSVIDVGGRHDGEVRRSYVPPLG